MLRSSCSSCGLRPSFQTMLASSRADTWYGKPSSSCCLLLSSWGLHQLLYCYAIDAVQASAWYLPPWLTRLDACYIGTPVGKRDLDTLFGNQPALEFVRLRFRTADPYGFECSTDSDDEADEHLPGIPVQRDDFPQKLLW